MTPMSPIEEEEELEECPYCEGTGMDDPDCEDCDATGVVIDPMTFQTYPCPACGGEYCSHCDGEGGGV